MVTLALSLALVAGACSSNANSGGGEDTVAGDVSPDGFVPEPDIQPDMAVEDLVEDVAADQSDVADAELGDLVEDVAPDVPEDLGVDLGVEIDESLYGVEFLEPLDGATVSGSIWIRIRPVEVEEWTPLHLVLSVDGVPVFADQKLPTKLVLDTTQYANGEHLIEVAVEVGDNTETGSVSLTFDNPDYRFEEVSTDQFAYRDGDVVEVDLCLEGNGGGLLIDADFAALDSAFAGLTEGSVVEILDESGLEPVATGCYRLVYTINPANAVVDGDYLVPITAARAEPASSLVYRNLTLPLRNTPTTPVDVEGAIFVDEPPPPATPAGQTIGAAPSATVTGNRYIITGGTARVDVNTSDSSPAGAADVIGVLVAVQGYSGFYQMPLPEGGGRERLALRLDPNAGVPDGATMVLQFAAIDRSGNVSAWAPWPVTTIEVLSGDVQVSVSWDVATDVDLHVLEPGGYELYYGNKGPTAWGGVLDLDSNAACGGQDVRNENVSWPIGSSPEGIYTVLIDYWSSCGGQTTNYTVTIKNCGEVSVFQGVFHPDQSSGGGACGQNEAAWAQQECVRVATFDNTCGYHADGYVRFQDRTFNAEGYRAVTWKPLRHAIVEARRASDGATMGYTSTDRFGYYDVNFKNDGTPGFYIVVRTMTDNADGLREIVVHNHPKFSQIYEFFSTVNYEVVGETVRVDVDVPLVDRQGVPASGACNIFDVALQGYDRIRRMTGHDLGPLKLYWQTGADTTATLYCDMEMFNSGFCTPLDSLQIQGLDADRDEFDDCVILREVYRFAESKITATDSPGWFVDGRLLDPARGPRDDPRRAWSEGMATFFSSNTRRDSIFVDKRFGGAYWVQDLETFDSPFAAGTRNNSMSGFVSEFLVASFLWDLVDEGEGDVPEPGVAEDPIRANPNGLYDAAFNYLGDPDIYVGGRGFPGRDFVDFLDGWFCRGHDQREAVEAVLEDLEFPYDYAGPESCQ